MTATALRATRPHGFGGEKTPSTRQRRATASAPKVRYIVVVLTGIFSILGIQLLLSIAVSDGAYEIASLKSDMRRSMEQRQMVQEDISALNAPDTLANLATAMGMVADNNPAYLRLSDGQVIGEAVPAGNEGASSVYRVTAGEDIGLRPAIVDDVLRTVTTAASTAVDGTEADATEAVTDEASVAETEPAVAPVSVPVSKPVVVPPSAPTKKYGGTIPAPVTR